ncbi:MAG: hypothetical protein EBS76_04935, partial [Actinobacteria bacterium]|nr:hypothetical protein [Actinomycetota bacterium]
MGNDPVLDMLPNGPTLTVGPLLGCIADQAERADDTRAISSDVISSLKASDVMRLSASRTIGGNEASILQIGRELEAVAARCTSTAWVLWNHLAVFHLFVGTLGPDHKAMIDEIVHNREWVCFPAGAGSGVAGVIDGDDVVLTGKGSFSSGGRYADWAGVVFAVCDDKGKR